MGPDLCIYVGDNDEVELQDKDAAVEILRQRAAGVGPYTVNEDGPEGEAEFKSLCESYSLTYLPPLA